MLHVTSKLMKPAGNLQPDQQPARWDDYVARYEEAFEPLTNAFGARALERLRMGGATRLIDVGAGSGGVALLAAAQGADVLAVDASQQMIARLRARSRDIGPGWVRTAVMDGMELAVADQSLDAAISVFGVILFPDAPKGMRELARVVRPGGRIALVTWTQTERYELAARLMAAAAAVRGPSPPPSTLPAQLRFREESAFRDLFTAAELQVETIEACEERWTLPSARWLADHIAFAPGMAALLGSFGDKREAVLGAFVAALERDQGQGTVTLSAVAAVGVATKT
jgi:SAM-dependent methyltransferase